MSSSAAPPSLGGPSNLASASPATTTANAAPSPVAPPAVSVQSPPYTFSVEAAPFIPSFMRAAAVPAPLPPPTTLLAEAEDGAGEGEEEEAEEQGEGEGAVSAASSEEHYRHHFSKQWMLCLEQMQGQEVGMLMEMMPLDIQDLYFDRLSDEYLHHDHEHKDKTVHALCAAQKMVQALSPEQLAYIEDYLVEPDALNPAAWRRRGSAHGVHHEDGDGGCEEEGEHLFMCDDDGMVQEEEEWLLEQMMVEADHVEEAAAAKQRN